MFLVMKKLIDKNVSWSRKHVASDICDVRRESHLCLYYSFYLLHYFAKATETAISNEYSATLPKDKVLNNEKEKLVFSSSMQEKSRLYMRL